jgi:hypothetical protein
LKVPGKSLRSAARRVAPISARHVADSDDGAYR